jgi:hypothetical protein
MTLLFFNQLDPDAYPKPSHVCAMHPQVFHSLLGQGQIPTPFPFPINLSFRPNTVSIQPVKTFCLLKYLIFFRFF